METVDSNPDLVLQYPVEELADEAQELDALIQGFEVRRARVFVRREGDLFVANLRRSEKGFPVGRRVPGFSPEELDPASRELLRESYLKLGERLVDVLAGSGIPVEKFSIESLNFHPSVKEETLAIEDRSYFGERVRSGVDRNPGRFHAIDFADFYFTYLGGGASFQGVSGPVEQHEEGSPVYEQSILAGIEAGRLQLRTFVPGDVIRLRDGIDVHRRGLMDLSFEGVRHAINLNYGLLPRLF